MTAALRSYLANWYSSNKALLALDSTTKASAYLNRATQLYRGEVFSNYRLNYYEALTTYYRKTGNYPKVTQYLDSTVVLKDSLKAVFSNKVLAESSLNAERYLTDLARINTEKNNAIWQRNLIIGSLILLGLAGFYLIEQRRQREKIVQNEKQKRAEEQLSHANAQLNQYLANLREKLEAAKQDTTINAIQQQQMMSLLDSVILTDKAWVNFRQLFEQVHPRFFETLQANYPDLTPAEIRLLTLQKLNITTKDMAFMLGVSAESIRKSRYRLRKKLGPSTAMTELVNLQDT